MSGVRFSQNAPLANFPTGLNIGVQVDGLFGLNTTNGLWTAEALSNLTDWAHSIEGQLSKATSNIFPEIAVLGDGGVLIGWIGSRDGFIGGWFKQLYVGGTDPTNAPLFADANGNVIIGQNGSISVRDIGGNEVGWEGVRTDSTLNITAATNASPTVVTLTAHGYVNGDTVFISGATGNTAINGYCIVENVTANTFTLTDLVGVVINGNGAYGGGGTSTRYFAGAWFQSFAIGGTGFPTSKIRAFADGRVVINASLVVDSNGATTSINNSVDGTAGVVGVRVKNDTPPSQDILMSDAGFFIRASDQFSYIAQINGAGDAGEVKINNIGGTQSITLLIAGGTPMISAVDSSASRSIVMDTSSGLTITSPSSIITLNSVTSTVKVSGVGTGQYVSISPNNVFVNSGGSPSSSLGPTSLRISSGGNFTSQTATDFNVSNASGTVLINTSNLKITGAGTSQSITISPNTVFVNSGVGATSSLSPSSLTIGGAVLTSSALNIVSGGNSTSHTATDFNVSNAGGTVLINTTNMKITGVGTGQNVAISPNTVFVNSGIGATASLSSTSLSFNSTQVLKSRITGWTTPTGTQYRGGYTVVSAAIIDLSEALAALIADLTTHGVIGA